jgi:hypothetical protein
MGFVMADVRPTLPTVSAGDERPFFELLKRHLCFEVSAIAMIDLDEDIRGSQIRFHQGIHGVIAVFLYPFAQQLFLQVQVHSLQSKRLSCSSLTIFSQGLVGLSNKRTRADVSK